MEFSMDNIADLIGSLSDADLDALRETAQGLFGQAPDGQDAPPKQNAPGISPEMIAKISRLMQAMQHEDQGRAALIAALKPYLSVSRQKRADEAMQMLRLLDILPLIGNGLF